MRDLHRTTEGAVGREGREGRAVGSNESARDGIGGGLGLGGGGGTQGLL